MNKDCPFQKIFVRNQQNQEMHDFDDWSYKKKYVSQEVRVSQYINLEVSNWNSQ